MAGLDIGGEVDLPLLVKKVKEVMALSKELDELKLLVGRSLDPGVYIVSEEGTINEWAVVIRRIQRNGRDQMEVSVKPTKRV